MREVTGERLTGPMNVGVTLSAQQLKVPRVVRAALFHLDDVVNLKTDRGPKRLEVGFYAKAVPTVEAHRLRQRFP